MSPKTDDEAVSQALNTEKALVLGQAIDAEGSVPASPNANAMSDDSESSAALDPYSLVIRLAQRSEMTDRIEEMGEEDVSAIPIHSSKNIWPFQAVHQMAIGKALKRDVPPTFIRILQNVQPIIDGNQADQWIHAMVTPESNTANEIRKANEFVREMILLVRSKRIDVLDNSRGLLFSLLSKIDSEGAASGLKALQEAYKAQSFDSKLLEPLWHRIIIIGIVMHLMQDATSPSHVFFQEWADAIIGKLVHVCKERTYPAADSAGEIFLEGATRWCWDLFSIRNKQMPDYFFDPSNRGLLLVEDQYLKGRSATDLANEIYSSESTL